MNSLQTEHEGMEVLSKEKMKQIVGGNQPLNPITECRITCTGPTSSYVIEGGTTCPEDGSGACFEWDDEVVFCECDFG